MTNRADAYGGAVCVPHGTRRARPSSAGLWPAGLPTLLLAWAVSAWPLTAEAQVPRVLLPTVLATADPAEELVLRRVQALRLQVQQLERQISDVQRRIPTLESEITRLTKQAEALTIAEPQKEDQPLPAEKPQEVPFRPPMLRTVDKDTPLAIVCKNGRAAILDLDESHASFKQLKDNRTQLEELVKTKSCNLSAGDFNIVLRVTVMGSTLLISQSAVQKPGRDGETLERARSETSALRTRLKGIDPAKAVIQFAVYPDSFDVFRGLRTLIWERKFSVNWVPMSHGEPIGIGGGSGVSVQ